MELDPQTALYLQRAEDRPHWEGMPVAEARALARAWHLEHATFDPKTTSARRGVVAHDVVASAQGHHIPIRLYRPPEAPLRSAPCSGIFSWRRLGHRRPGNARRTMPRALLADPGAGCRS